MVFIRVTVTGLKECQAALTKAKADLPNTMKLMLTDICNNFVSEGQKNAHVITGNMKANIMIESINQQIGQATVGALADYSIYENARGPPHNFMDRAYQTTKQNSLPIVINYLNGLLRTSGVPLH